MNWLVRTKLKSRTHNRRKNYYYYCCRRCRCHRSHSIVTESVAIVIVVIVAAASAFHETIGGALMQSKRRKKKKQTHWTFVRRVCQCVRVYRWRKWFCRSTHFIVEFFFSIPHCCAPIDRTLFCRSVETYVPWIHFAFYFVRRFFTHFSSAEQSQTRNDYYELICKRCVTNNFN